MTSNISNHTSIMLANKAYHTSNMAFLSYIKHGITLSSSNSNIWIIKSQQGYMQQAHHIITKSIACTLWKHSTKQVCSSLSSKQDHKCLKITNVWVTFTYLAATQHLWHLCMSMWMHVHVIKIRKTLNKP